MSKDCHFYSFTAIKIELSYKMHARIQKIFSGGGGGGGGGGGVVGGGLGGCQTQFCHCKPVPGWVRQSFTIAKPILWEFEGLECKPPAPPSGSTHEMHTVVGARGILRLHDYNRGFTGRGRERHKSSDARRHPV